MAQEFTLGHPQLNGDDRAALNAFFSAVQDVCRQLAADPTLTAGSPSVVSRIARLETQARDVIDRRGQNKPDKTKTLEDALALCKALIKAMTAEDLQGYWKELNAVITWIMAPAGGRQENG